MKLTRWYSGDQKPLRKGVYQVKSDGVYFSYFDGKNFNGCWFTTERAAENQWSPVCHGKLQWRGVAK